ncbi:MAG: hypothetical protein IT379_14270 [Deltaproteobacteria bacterium]|nr:hypothetical protein [Deltaproteobacteria bacterium]
MERKSSIHEELSLARRAWQEHDLEHAAHHWAGAMAIEPDSSALRAALVDAWEREGEEWLEVVALEQGMFAGAAALRAWFVARSGATADALLLLLKAQAAVPSSRYLRLAREWVDDADYQSTDCVALAGAAAALLPMDDPRDVQLVLEILEHAHEAHPDDDVVFLLLAVAHRDHGEEERARSLVEQRVEERPSFEAWIAFAGWHRDRGDPLEALFAFRKAIEHRPGDISALLDIGDLNLEMGALDAARRAYAEVLSRVPDHEWALPSMLYVRAIERDDAARQELARHARSRRDAERAIDLATRALPFDVEIPRRPEACLGFGRLRGSAQVTEIAISSIEAPSAFASLRKTIGKSVALTVNEIPTPDPRDPIESVPFTLWQFGKKGLWNRLFGSRPIEGTPCFGPPTVDVWSALGELADSPFEPSEWWRRAGELAPAITQDGLEPVFGAMLHPPPAPELRTPWDWMFRVQIAAAFVLARMADPWPGRRREALRALVFGPVDWVSTAALVALAEIAIREPDHRRDAQQIVADAITIRPTSPIVVMCLIEPGVHLLLRVPDLDPALRGSLEDRRADFEARS